MVFTADRVLQYSKKRMMAMVTGTMSINRCRTRRAVSYLATPQNRVASRDFQLVLQFALRLFDIVTNGDVRQVDENILGKQSLFVANHGSASQSTNAGQLGQWDLFVATEGHQHAAERFQVRPEVAQIADVDRVQLPGFDHCADVCPPTAVESAS